MVFRKRSMTSCFAFIARGSRVLRKRNLLPRNLFGRSEFDLGIDELGDWRNAGHGSVDHIEIREQQNRPMFGALFFGGGKEMKSKSVEQEGIDLGRQIRRQRAALVE